MQLIVKNRDTTRTIEAFEGKTLSESLNAAGIRLCMACGGNNRCGRCQVKLLAGKFRIGKEDYDATVKGERTVNSCATIPAEDFGRIAIPASSLLPDNEIIESGIGVELDLSDALPGIGVAFDIGTTTIAGALVANGRIRAVGGLPNPQSRFGDNVIDRIVYAGRSPMALEEMRRTLIDEALDLLLLKLTDSPESIDRIAIAANTVMSHIFYGVSPESIGVAPFCPRLLNFPVKQAKEYGLAVNPEASVAILPALSGNVGGDVTGGIAATHFGRNSEKNELLLDIGTNCEIVLSIRGKRFAASAAAGPAFEGSSATVGSRAGRGAIDHMNITESGVFNFHVIGGDLRRINGICGSGLVDFLASARVAGLLDTNGRFDWLRLENLGRLLPGTPQSGCGCLLAENLSIYESDVESLLKAKAAIAGGVAALLNYAGIRPEELDMLYLCGAFAAKLNLDSARRIGLIPPLSDERIKVCGNTSLAGAILAVAKPEVLELLESERQLYTNVNLNELECFQSYFTEALTLNAEVE
ncbi:MAG: ASKHA domain-containing protein [Victivallales bacterium]|jgi:uncharacterized 2Fe-2S/4Fe-4S cluster protein (DUF4445 family)|nr:ASKHA domain-containing protein [Victivallales bacterium]